MFRRRPFQRIEHDTVIVRGNCAFNALGTYSSNAVPQWYANTSHFRASSSSSSKQWQNRHGKDRFAQEAKVRGLKSRAAFKLLEINEKYRIFKHGQTVVDLGYAPGSWSQVAVDRTYPDGRVIGLDIIPALPPKGVSTIQGNFLSPSVQEELKKFLLGPEWGSMKEGLPFSAAVDDRQIAVEEPDERSVTYVKAEKGAECAVSKTEFFEGRRGRMDNLKKDVSEGRLVDVVLSDMSEPWAQTDGFWKRSLSDPYYRMMNTSGMSFRDHAGSMDLCTAALRFAFDTLHTGGHFVCKFYQGSEDKAFELRLKGLFAKVHREKPISSRSESKEAYLVALRRKAEPLAEDIFKYY